MSLLHLQSGKRKDDFVYEEEPGAFPRLLEAEPKSPPNFFSDSSPGGYMVQDLSKGS